MTPDVVTCDDLDGAVAERKAMGFRLDATGPADEPTWAQLSNGEQILYLDADSAAGSERFLADDLVVPPAQQALTVVHETDFGWTVGRAEMAYRDLIPDRLGGAYIASHINVKQGGPVPDYVHHHDIALQLIYCHRGWVRVVYQDQGPSFVLEPGDCILQPPGIRHQVLESSDELFVTEVSCPAEHRTSLDHDLTLPNDPVELGKVYGRGQRFLRHDSSEVAWQPLSGTPFEQQTTEMESASAGVGDLRFLRVTEESLAKSQERSMSLSHELDFRFLFISAGDVELVDESDGTIIDRLTEGSSVAVPSGSGYRLSNPTVNTSLMELKCRRT